MRANNVWPSRAARFWPPATNLPAMSNTGRRLALLLLVAIAFIALAPAAFAVTDIVAQGDLPAIVVPEPAPVDEVPSWTYRFLIPTLLVVAVLVIVVTVIQYFVKVVGKRYRVVQ